MSEWIFNIDDAPRGSLASETLKSGKTVEVFKPDWIIVATKCGKVICTHYLPKDKRWMMLGTKEQPVAWMPWPEHPSPKQKVEA